MMPCEQQHEGRYVAVIANHSEPFTLCEFELYGTPREQLLPCSDLRAKRGLENELGPGSVLPGGHITAENLRDASSLCGWVFLKNCVAV